MPYQKNLHLTILEANVAVKKILLACHVVIFPLFNEVFFGGMLLSFFINGKSRTDLICKDKISMRDDFPNFHSQCRKSC